MLTAIKERYAAAKTGHDLLKRKSDAIKVNLNNILKKILVTKRRVGVSIKESFFSFTEAHWAAGDFNNIVIENTKEASYRIRTKINNVAGVKLPVFDRAISTNTGKGQSARRAAGGCSETRRGERLILRVRLLTVAPCFSVLSPLQIPWWVSQRVVNP